MVQIVEKKNFKLIKKLIVKKNEDNFERLTLLIGKYDQKYGRRKTISFNKI